MVKLKSTHRAGVRELPELPKFQELSRFVALLFWIWDIETRGIFVERNKHSAEGIAMIAINAKIAMILRGLPTSHIFAHCCLDLGTLRQEAFLLAKQGFCAVSIRLAAALDSRSKLALVLIGVAYRNW